VTARCLNNTHTHTQCSQCYAQCCSVQLELL